MKKKLTKRQNSLLKKHSIHHTKIHIKEMKALMLKGKSFDFAHMIAKRKVGL